MPPLFDRAVAGSGRAFSVIERAEQLWGPAGGLVGPVRAATGLAGSSAVMALGWLPPLQQGHRPVTFARSQPLTAAVLSTSRSTSDTRPSSRSATGQPAFPRALSPRDKAASQAWMPVDLLPGLTIADVILSEHSAVPAICRTAVRARLWGRALGHIL